MSNKYLHYISAFTLGMAIILMFYFGFLLFYPFKTIKFDKDSFQTIKTEYRPGEVFDYVVAYTKYTNKSATVLRYFVDGIVFQLPPTQTNNPIGKQRFINRTVTIPTNLPPGKYFMTMTLIYKVNSFREISHCVKTNEFSVIDETERERQEKQLMQGIQGEQGVQGIQGIQGVQGVQGIKGKE